MSGNVRDRKNTPLDLGLLAAGIVLMLGSTVLGLISLDAKAEPVEVQQVGSIGAGHSFRRGTTCFVITALHVVREMGADVVVLDRTGAKTTKGKRIYASPDLYDLALIELPANAGVACTTTWPDVAWMRQERSLTSGNFRAIRHYPDGRESIVRLAYGGASKDELLLAHVDKTGIQEGDSGSIVEFEGRLAGIVKEVRLSTDRVAVLRFDRIDDLIGDRFRSASGNRVVGYAGVMQGGRENPTWSKYVQAWMVEKDGLTVIPAARAAGETPRPPCEVKVDVLSWDRVPVNNPEFDGLQLQLQACGKRGAVWEAFCKQAQTASATTPRQVVSQKIVLNVTVTPSGAAPLTKLTSSTHVPKSSKLSQPEIELASLLAVVGPTLKELMDRGACN